MEQNKHIARVLNTIPSKNFNNNIGFRNNTGTGSAAQPGAPFNMKGGYKYAAGMGIQPTAQPYIVQISNPSATSGSVQIFGANTHLSGYGTFSSGTLTAPNGITVSTTFANTTYYGLLSQSLSQSFMVGATRLQVTSGSVLPNSINWNNTDQGNGNSSSGTLTFPLSDFQQVNTQVTNKDAYPMNANTTLTITIAASTTILLWVYPQVIVDPSQATVGDAPVTNYSSPGINPAGTFQVG